MNETLASGGSIFSLPVAVGILAAAVRMATPYLFAAIGESIGQCSGVFNLGVDGVMVLGAFAAFYVTMTTGSLWLGVAAALFVGLLMGLLMSLISVTLKAEQGISGIGLYMFGLGLSTLLFKVLVGSVKTISGFQPLKIPLLCKIPLLGEIFFQQSLPVYAAFATVPLAWLLLDKTTWGLRIRAVGHSPAAADSLGVNVDLVRYCSVTVGSMLAALGGASLSLMVVNLFQENLTAGIGFIAVALVYFGGWRPVSIMAGALLFSLVNALQLWMQVLNVRIPSDLAVMLPYILTILVLTFAPRASREPMALNRPFERGEH